MTYLSVFLNVITFLSEKKTLFAQIRIADASVSQATDRLQLIVVI